jgi:hypothetical protein
MVALKELGKGLVGLIGRENEDVESDSHGLNATTQVREGRKHSPDIIHYLVCGEKDAGYI